MAGSALFIPPMSGKTRKWLLAAVVLIVFAYVYFYFSPTEERWFPKCMLKLITGYDCPSCGAQRALHAALHGHFAEAIHYNLFLLVGMPYLTAAVIASAGKGRVSEWVNRRLLSPVMLWIYIGLYMIWWIVRNIIGM